MNDPKKEAESRWVTEHQNAVESVRLSRLPKPMPKMEDVLRWMKLSMPREIIGRRQDFIERLVDDLAQMYQMDAEDIVGSSRVRRAMEARLVLISLLTWLGLTLREITDRTGLERTTALYFRRRQMIPAA